MSHNAIDIQIKSSYEQGMTPEDIALDQGLEVAAVKSKLLQVCNQYSQDIGAVVGGSIPNPLDFSDEELEQSNKVIVETMLGATNFNGDPDWKTRLSAATYVRDDKKGRKEAKKLIQNNTFNMLEFNEKMAMARQGAERLKERVMPQMKVITQ
jgi:hypothetical protein